MSIHFNTDEYPINYDDRAKPTADNEMYQYSEPEVAITSHKLVAEKVTISLFHKLWDKAYSSKDYDKLQWMALQRSLLELGVRV